MITDETLSRNFRALSHPRRAMIFRRIVNDPTIGSSLESLITATGLHPSSLVHHLREMERCGILTRQRKGLVVAYHLTPGAFSSALATAMRMSEAGRAGAARAA